MSDAIDAFMPFLVAIAVAFLLLGVL